jgi:hypothetical protein
MLRVTGRDSDRGGFCDGINRRRFLEVGSLGVFGLTLSDLLRAESRGSQYKSDKSVILIWQHGGPSQLDTFDMKPLAPSNIRGPYSSIASSLPGLRVGELLPYQARIMDKVSVIRSFSHGNGDHWAAAHWMLTAFVGANGSDRRPRNPSIGACVSKLLGPRDPGVPATVNFNDGGFGFHGGAYLGVAHNPFRLGEFSYGNEAGRLPTADHKSFTLVDGLSKVRLGDRLGLSRQFDRFRRQVDESPVFDSIDEIDQQAVDILMSGKAKAAFELDREDKKTREKYGPGWGEQALLCRRLIEAGARFVSLNTGYWDDHGNLKGALDNKMPRHDRAVGVLIEDLAQRGMLENTLVVTAGEFGRTPKINGNAGRDHWPQAQSILVAGGGYRGGQVIGTTDKEAARPTSRKVDVADFCRIVYRGIGMTGDEEIVDPGGRPVHLVYGGKVPRELL